MKTAEACSFFFSVLFAIRLLVWYVDAIRSSRKACDEEAWIKVVQIEKQSCTALPLLFFFRACVCVCSFSISFNALPALLGFIFRRFSSCF